MRRESAPSLTLSGFDERAIFSRWVNVNVFGVEPLQMFTDDFKEGEALPGKL